MAWNKKLTQLNDVLGELVFRQERIETHIKEAGMKPQHINFSGTAYDIWNSVIGEANKNHQIDDLISTMLKRYPKDPYLIAASKKEKINYSLDPDINTFWQDPTDSDIEEFEKLTLNSNTLLPINFLTRGIQCSRPIAKIEIIRGISDIDVGTGFLAKIKGIDELFFVTNYHVIYEKEDIKITNVLFDYERDVRGNVKNHKTFKIDSNSYWWLSNTINLDVCICKLEATDKELEEFGYLELEKAKVKKNDFVNIIQHPGGQYKQISLYQNIVTHTDKRVIQYLTDTLKGSSGAPVFDSNWNVVALHHSGGKRRPGEPPLPMNAKSRNEGIQINKIIDFIKKKYKQA